MRNHLIIISILFTINSFSQDWKTNTYSTYSPSPNPNYSSADRAKDVREITELVKIGIAKFENEKIPTLEYWLLDPEKCKPIFNRKCENYIKRLNKYKDLYKRLSYTGGYFEKRKEVTKSFSWINEMMYRVDKKLTEIEREEKQNARKNGG